MPLVEGSVGDGDLLREAFDRHRVRGVIHLAAKKQVGESVERPLYYYRENVQSLVRLLEAMQDRSVPSLVFSSSAAVYGSPDVDFVTEATPTVPQSPYGETKLIGEWLIKAAAKAHGLRYASLRYFNVAGAGRPELADTVVSNLIPMVFERLSAGRRPMLFGDDYPTPDGSCVRDFIHVADLADAHVAALHHLEGDGPDLVLNVGSRGGGVGPRGARRRRGRDRPGHRPGGARPPGRRPGAGGGVGRRHRGVLPLAGAARPARHGGQRVGGLDPGGGRRWSCSGHA